METPEDPFGGGDDDTGFILSESIASNSVTDAITLTIQQLPENTTLVKVFGDES